MKLTILFVVVVGAMLVWRLRSARRAVSQSSCQFIAREYFSPTANQYCKGNLLSVEGSMIDVALNVAVFAALVLCIGGIAAWAHKRVP